MEQRLIDANELFEQAQHEDYSSSDDVNTTLFMIGNAQTVNAIVIPDNATNGDMIKAMFPSARIMYGNDGLIGVWLFKHVVWFKESWWNSPYRKEQE